MTITWEQVLAFLCEDQTMAITSLLFLAFFAAVALINYALPRVLRPYFLLAASYGFFCYDPVNRPLVWVIAAATVLTWLCGLIIGKVRAKPVRVLALAASVGFGIGILVYYKYWNLLADTVGGSILSHRENLLAPLGLSYFTFGAMSYTIDVYKRRCRVETNLLHYALFVSFFPTLINGPIERYPQMRPQIRKSRRFSYGRCAGGAFRMLWGYTKKMVLADNLSHYVSLVYGDVGSMSGPNLVAATVLFAVQLYMDFSGCCDIALGAARILGYDLIENFQSPFEARTFNDFWRRWHISMTSWFRDYVYIPLGGSRCSRSRWLLNVFLVWGLTGLWHGAAWNFVLWGLLFAALLLAEKWIPVLQRLPGVLRHGYVLLAVVLSFVLFNADSLAQAGQDFAGLFGFGSLSLTSAETLYYLKSYAVLFVLGILGSTPVVKNAARRIDGTKAGVVLEAAAMLALLIVCTAYLVDGSFSPFLYFRF